MLKLKKGEKVKEDIDREQTKTNDELQQTSSNQTDLVDVRCLFLLETEMSNVKTDIIPYEYVYESDWSL